MGPGGRAGGRGSNLGLARGPSGCLSHRTAYLVPRHREDPPGARSIQRREVRDRRRDLLAGEFRDRSPLEHAGVLLVNLLNRMEAEFPKISAEQA